MSVPSRKQRNQPANRVHDIEFVTDISTSLLGQVRQLQGVLAERDETIKALGSEKSQLELESRGLSQRLKTLDESEQRYKDENWSLETQTHELTAAAKENASKEQKLTQGLAIATSAKIAAQRELDEVKQALGKLGEDHHLFRKHHESELGTLRKNVTTAETSRDALHKKIEELTSQNEELAKAVAGRYRFDEDAPMEQSLQEPEDLSLQQSDLDHSPPPSPQKGAARNTVLESETLRSSLQHAHRMIQSLKNGITKEKAEKNDLKRMLHESRDELEARRNDLGSTGSKGSKAKSQQNGPRKMPKQGQLGARSSGRIYIEDDPDWEEHAGNEGLQPQSRSIGASSAPSGNASEAYQTTAETDAFETANERESNTETDAFQTGAESLAGESSDDLTETEAGPARAAPARGSRVPSMPGHMKRQSFISTASSSDEEASPEPQAASGPLGKFRLKLNRSLRRSGPREGTPSSVRDSPASGAGSGTPQGPGQSLFAELGDLGGEGSDYEMDGTPSKVRGSTLSPGSVRTTREATAEPVKAQMVSSDTGTMTDPWEPPAPALPPVAAVPAAAATPKKMVDAGTQRTPERHSAGLAPQDTPPKPQMFGALGHPRQSVEGSTQTIAEENAAAAAPVGDNEETQTQPSSSQTRVDTSSKSEEKKDLAKGGLIGSVIGWAVGGKAAGHKEDASKTAGQKENPSKLAGSKEEASTAIGQAEVPNNDIGTTSVEPATDKPREEAVLPKPSETLPSREQAIAAPTKADSSSQTALSASQIDRLLAGKESRPAPIATTAPTKPRSLSASNGKDTTPGLAAQIARASLTKDQPPTRAARRPNSSGSVRIQSGEDMPPLPAHHQQAIAAAQQTPSKSKENNMGPPTMPASAYRTGGRRPETPQERNLQSPGSATPRARYSTARSMRSRRSSVSSFESELDARFNIRADGTPMARGIDGSTDPRMIQAITQTMIGEYLWKYTRKAGRGEMSDKRHRRFFWVHPYTRTLYWSNQDPAQAGRAQLKAKSVAIEAVRVVVDDNPMPPGLHRKSLLVITPGRDVKFTATTGQRHETWFNALSYLLLRSGADQADPGLTPDELAEFNPNVAGAGSTLRAGSRVSLASHRSQSRTGGAGAGAAGMPARPQSRTHSRASSRDPSPSKRSSIPAMPHANAGGGSAASRVSRASSSLSARVASYWRPGRPASQMSTGMGESSRASGSVYGSSALNDSAEDVRQVLEKQEQESDRLENVRACCDGKSFP